MVLLRRAERTGGKDGGGLKSERAGVERAGRGYDPVWGLRWALPSELRVRDRQRREEKRDKTMEYYIFLFYRAEECQVLFTLSMGIARDMGMWSVKPTEVDG